MTQIIIPDNQRQFPRNRPVGVWINGQVEPLEIVEKALSLRFGTPSVAYSFVVTTSNDCQDVVCIISADGPLETFAGVLHNLEIPAPQEAAEND